MPQPVSNRRSRRYRTNGALITTVLLCAALFSLAPSLLVDGGHLANAQISPLSPLQAVDSGGPAISLSGTTVINVMASGQAQLMRLALLLIAIIGGAAVLVWRQT